MCQCWNRESRLSLALTNVLSHQTICRGRTRPFLEEGGSRPGQCDLKNSNGFCCRSQPQWIERIQIAGWTTNPELALSGENWPMWALAAGWPARNDEKSPWNQKALHAQWHYQTKLVLVSSIHCYAANDWCCTGHPAQQRRTTAGRCFCAFFSPWSSLPPSVAINGCIGWNVLDQIVKRATLKNNSVQQLNLTNLDIEQKLHHITFIHYIILPFTTKPTLIASFNKGSSFN